MFGRKHKINKLEYNPDIEKPVIISSICTGEQRAGIKDIKTGHFKEIMLINNQKDLIQNLHIHNFDLPIFLQDLPA